MTSDVRARILERVSTAVDKRPRRPHPGPFGGWRPAQAGGTHTAAQAYGAWPVDAFIARFTEAGGEVVRLGSELEARAWLASITADVVGVSFGTGVSASLRPDVTTAPPEDAAIGISRARGAVGETGSLIMDARDGRAAQLLPPTHIILVDATTVHATLAEAFEAIGKDLPSAIGLHSGPSKSADLGKIMVTGVHGPGRVVAGIIG